MGSELDRVRDHLANERTFLAWVRTAVGIVVFGFAIGRFGLALRQLAGVEGQHLRSTGMSLWFGSASILFGVFVMVAGFLRYRRTQYLLEQNRYETSAGLIGVVAAITVLFSLALVFYLVMAQRMLE